MLKNYFKIAWRNLIKGSSIPFLNLFGLSIGLACALFIWLWVSDEWNMDKNNKKDDNLYQVMQNLKEENGITTMDYTAGLLANALQDRNAGGRICCDGWFRLPGFQVPG